MHPVVLLDTNIVSYAFKGDSRIRLYAADLKDRKPAISFMTTAELFQWSAVHQWGARKRASLRKALKRYFFLPVDLELCRLWGQVRADCRAAGRPISPQDAWIGATALQYALPLVTHNPSHFEAVEGLEIISRLT